MPRLVLTGTKDKLAKPTEKELALPDWNNSYLAHVDLSGLSIPPMVDADVIDYRAVDTVFSDTSYTQFRTFNPALRPLQGAVFPDASHWQFDFIEEILSRHLDVALDPYTLLLRDYVRDNKYDRVCWEDAVWRLVQSGFLISNLNDLSKRIWASQPKLMLWALKANTPEGIKEGADMAATPFERVMFLGMEDRELDLSDIKPVSGFDRWLAARLTETIVEQRTGEPTHCWYAMLHPNPVLFLVARSRVSGGEWWRRAWPS